MTSVYFDPAVGGDGSTVSDDANPLTGLERGGHRERFIPALKQLVAIAQYMIDNGGEGGGGPHTHLGSGIVMPSVGTVAGGVSATRDFSVTGSAGVIDGQAVYITQASANTINIAAGEGYLRTTNSPLGNLVFCSWAAMNGVVIPAPAAGLETARFVGIEYNAGSPRVTVRSAFDWNWATDFPLGRVTLDSETPAEMKILNAYAHSEDTANLTRKMLRLTMPFQREIAPEGSGGLVVGNVATRRLTLSAGKMWHGFNQYSFDALNSNTDAFHVYHSNGAGGFTHGGTVNQWPNTQYQNTATGALVTLSNANKYACLWIYLDIADKGLDCVYGTAEYNSAILAQAEAEPAIPAHLQYHGRPIGRFIFQKAVDTPAIIESTWDSGFSASGTTDHLQLSNVGTNTHAQIDAFIASTNLITYSETMVSVSGTSHTIDLATGTLFKLSATGNFTCTLPAVATGKSFMVIAVQDATGNRTFTFSHANLKWAGTAPTASTAANKIDFYSFLSDGVNWYGSQVAKGY